MRAPFNTTLGVRYGSRSVVGPPGAVWASDIPCRVVPQTEITQGQFPFTLSSAWVTVDAVRLHGPFTSSPWLGAVFTDQLAADEVSFPGLDGPWFSVQREEDVQPFGRDPYWRYLLVPLSSVVVPPWPPPSPPPPAPPPPPVPPVVPGHDCDDALPIGVGEEQSFSDPAPDWFEVVGVAAGTWRIAYTGDVTFAVYAGTSCGDSVGLVLSLGDGCVGFVTGFVYDIWIEVFGDGGYTFTLESGECGPP